MISDSYATVVFTVLLIEILKEVLNGRGITVWDIELRET
jgi:hypothetical protein